jgi:predicted acetyltransferase
MDVRPVSDREEFARAAFMIGQYFGEPPKEEDIERWLALIGLERMHAALVDQEIVGAAAAFTFDFTVPGGTMPCAGVTFVGVSPTHRRRGVLTEMMRVQLDDIRERGEPIAALWASEERIYPRFGYGMASLAGEIAIPRDRAAFSVAYEPVGRVRLVDRAEAEKAFPAVWEVARLRTPGTFARSPDWWQHRTLNDPESWRDGAGPKRFVVHETDGAVDGYAVYRHAAGWEGGVSSAKLKVLEAVGTVPEATRELWRYLLDVDWTKTIESWLLPPDHPLFLLLAEPRRANYRVWDGIWVRLVDVGTALSGRAYAADGRVVFEVRDSFGPWNEGRWRLEDGEAERTDDEPDLRLDVTALGSVFLGGFTFAELQRACRVEEATEGAIERADAMFRTDVAPWCPEIF